MINNSTSIYLFLLGCIPTRIVLVLIAAYLSRKYLPYYGVILLGPAMGFLYLYFFKLRMNAPEAGGPTWWANFRIIHGLLYLAAAILAIQRKSIAWVPLAIDVIFGLCLFIYHRFLSI